MKKVHQCSDCGGFCKPSGCERENIPIVTNHDTQLQGWATIQDLADSKGVPAPAREALLAMQEKLSNYIKIHDAVVTDNELAYERIKELEEELARVKENLRIEREVAVRDQKRIAGITAICKEMFT